jgi:phosphate transport system protein
MPFLDRYDQGIREVEQRVGDLAEATLHMLESSLNSLMHQDLVAAADVITYDDVIDDETDGIERSALELMSFKQPTQDDLRVLAASLRIVRDLERIADYACDIAEITEVLGVTPRFKPLDDLSRMGDLTLTMIERATEAVVTRSIAIAYEVSRRDDAVDALYLSLHRELMETMKRDPALVEEASHLALVARYLERIAEESGR